jgi:hypothetical protein
MATLTIDDATMLKLEERARRVGLTVDQFLQQVVAREDSPDTEADHAKWRAALQAFIDRAKSRPPVGWVDDDRGSMNERESPQ